MTGPARPLRKRLATSLGSLLEPATDPRQPPPSAGTRQDELLAQVRQALLNVGSTHRRFSEQIATGTMLAQQLREQAAMARRIVLAGGPLAVAVGAFTLYMVAEVPFSAIVPAFFTDSLHASTEEFGFMLSLRGVAGILGGVLIVSAARRIQATALLAGGLLTYGFAIGVQGIINSFWPGLWFLVLVGPAAAAIQTGMNTLLQEASPDRERGRVFALVGVLAGIVTIAMSVSAGALADTIGTRPIVVASGLLQILPAMLILRRFPRQDVAPKVV